MTLFLKHKHIQRGGAQYRQHPDRYFEIEEVGWFVRTRGDYEAREGMDVSSGILGPFKSKAVAKYELFKMLFEEQPDLFKK